MWIYWIQTRGSHFSPISSYAAEVLHFFIIVFKPESERERERQREREKETERATERETHTQRETEIERDKERKIHYFKDVEKTARKIK